jgi:glycosyltransferase involved in cell wall biosynthesis
VISVLFPTRNRADLLAAALESLSRQELPPREFEVLVVDNGSSDHTPAVARAHAERLGNLRYVHEAEPGLHAGRHRGALEARGDILTFADDDIEAAPSWLAAVQEAFRDPDVAMVGGNNLPRFLEEPPAWLLGLWNRSRADGGRAFPPLSILELPGPARPLSPLYVWGCNFSVRKDVLRAAGGFHPDGMPRELIRFRGDGETHVAHYVAHSVSKCLFHPGASVCHKVTPERMTFEYLRRRGFDQGVSDSYTALRNQEAPDAPPRPDLFRRITRSAWRRIERVMITDPGVRRALRELRLGRREGYAYHQRMYQEDAAVRAWVHRRTYLAPVDTARWESTGAEP